MSSTKIKNRIKGYFTQPFLLRSAFYLTSQYLSGIHVSQREKKIKHYFISPLEKGVIQPSFNKKNIKNASLLGKRLKEGVKKLHLSGQMTACLIPELALRAFVFSFGSLPASVEEKEQIIRFRVKKQIALLPDDARFSFDVIKSDHSEKVIVSMARASVIQEYEDFFSHLGLKVKAVNSPLLSLYNVVKGEKAGDFLIVNIEEDSLSVLAVANSEIVLYRQKPLVLETEAEIANAPKIENIVKEVENTANFIEDREKKRINSLIIRLGFLSSGNNMFALLKEKLSFPLQRIDISLAQDLAGEEKQFLSPLIGQILC